MPSSRLDFVFKPLSQLATVDKAQCFPRYFIGSSRVEPTSLNCHAHFQFPVVGVPISTNDMEHYNVIEFSVLTHHNAVSTPLNGAHVPQLQA